MAVRCEGTIPLFDPVAAACVFSTDIDPRESLLVVHSTRLRIERGQMTLTNSNAQKNSRKSNGITPKSEVAFGTQ